MLTDMLFVLLYDLVEVGVVQFCEQGQIMHIGKDDSQSFFLL